MLTTLTAAATGELPTKWLLARSSGIVAYVALTLAVVAGLTLRSRLVAAKLPPAVVTAIHHSLSLVGLVATIAHALLIGLDAHVDVPLVSLVVPGLAGYRPLATGLGVVALELWLVVHVSFRLRRRIGMGRWRALHLLTLPTWLLAAGHGVLAGTDSATAPLQLLYAGSIAVVCFLLVLRLGSRPPQRARPPAAPPVRPTTDAAPAARHEGATT